MLVAKLVDKLRLKTLQIVHFTRKLLQGAQVSVQGTGRMTVLRSELFRSQADPSLSGLIAAPSAAGDLFQKLIPKVLANALIR